MRFFVIFLVVSGLGFPLKAEKILQVCDDIAEPQSLNPYQVFSEKTHNIIQQILEGLIRFNPKGGFEPALAERWERLGPEKIRFFLRKDVSFHNGEPADAKAVKFSIERYVDPKVKFPAIGYLGTIRSVEIVDEHTVDVLTNGPDGLLLNRLAAWVHIMPPKYFEKVGDAGFAQSPVGTGAFQFDQWIKGERIVLKANKNYWMKGFPRMDGLVFQFIPSEQQVEKLLKGEVDIVTELPGTRTADVMNSGIAKVAKQDSLYAMVAAFNSLGGQLKDRRLRQAISHAVNAEEIIRYDVFGNGKRIATSTMPGEEGHEPELAPYAYDKKKARALLKEAGFEKGLKITALVKEQGMRAGKIIKKQLMDVGIEMEIHLSKDANGVQDIASRSWDMYVGGCPDPMVHSFFIQSIFFYSKSPYALSKNPYYDSLLEGMAMTLDPDERKKKARLLNQYLYNEVLGSFIYQRIKTYGVSNKIEFTPYVTGMAYFFSVSKED